MFYYTHIEYFKSRFLPNTLHSLFTALLTSVSHYELQYNIFHVPLVQPGFLAPFPYTESLFIGYLFTKHHNYLLILTTT